MHWSLTDVVGSSCSWWDSARWPRRRRPSTVDSFGKAIANRKTVDVTALGTMTYDPKTHTYSLPMFTYSYEPTLKRLVAKQQVG
ncbi:MAG TPA: hypothetical protein VIA11_24520 [Acidimicrobiia bacterium]|nr:hypothetical protein [Acidimicrobiia bacterium]